MNLRIPPPLVAAIVALLMWLSATFMPVVAIADDTRRAIALVFFVAGLCLDLTALVFFSRARTTVTPLHPERSSALVTHGPYRFTRNPMYLGMLLLLTGWAVWLGSVLNVLLLGGFVAWITYFQIRPEEAVLREKFPEAFTQYRATTRRWI